MAPDLPRFYRQNTNISTDSIGSFLQIVVCAVSSHPIESVDILVNNGGLQNSMRQQFLLKFQKDEDGLPRPPFQSVINLKTVYNEARDVGVKVLEAFRSGLQLTKVELIKCAAI